jgi:hypothetical protein
VVEVREKSRLEFVHALEVHRAFIQLGVERKHTTVRFRQLLRQAFALRLLGAELLEHAKELLVLLLQLGGGIRRAVSRHGGHRRTDHGWRDTYRGRDALAENDLGSGFRSGLERERVAEATRPHDSQSQAGGGHVPSLHHFLETRDAAAPIGDPCQEHCGRAGIDPELHLSACGVLVSVPHDLRHRGREADLVLWVELELRGQLTRALPCEHDVIVAPEIHRQQYVCRHHLTSLARRR